MFTRVVCDSLATLLRYNYASKYSYCFIKYRFCLEKHVTGFWSRFALSEGFMQVSTGKLPESNFSYYSMPILQITCKLFVNIFFKLKFER